MLLDDLQCALTQAAALAHIGGETDAALGLFCGGQGLHGLAVSGVQLAEAGSGAADTDDAMLPQGTLGQLADLVGQNVQVLVEIRRVSEQHSHHMVVAEKRIVAQIFVGQLVHHPDETGSVLAIVVRLGGQHHQLAAVIGAAQQAAGGSRGAQGGFDGVGGIIAVFQHQRDQEGRAVLLHDAAAAQASILVVDALMDGFQLGGQAVHGERFEHVADDVVLDGLLGVLEIIVAA